MNLQTIKPRARQTRTSSPRLAFWEVVGMGIIAVGWTLDEALRDWQDSVRERYLTARPQRMA